MVHVNLKTDGCVTTWKTFIDAYDYPWKTYLSTSSSKLSWEDEKSSCWGNVSIQTCCISWNSSRKVCLKIPPQHPSLIGISWLMSDCRREGWTPSTVFKCPSFLFREKDNSDVKHMKHEKTWTFFSMDYKSYVQLLWMITITYWIHKKGYCGKHIFLARGFHHGAGS